MAMESIELEAQKRELVGKSQNSLRRKGFLPSVIYGHNFEPIPIQIKYSDFEKVFKKAGESTLINLKINDKEEPAIIKDVQKDPVSDKVIHADFYKVNLKEKIRAKIPLVLIGESEAVKAGGVLIKTLSELEVEALPQDLPHELQIDISSLKNFGSHISVKDISFSDKIKIEANPEDIVALVQEPKKEVIEEAAAPSVEDVEVIKKAPIEGEGGVEGKVIEKTSEEQK
ncbi:MAG: large subunit ribosomal protein L25 [Parcubacteria group bacterium Gr01-1014_2]|nr:MAG: large subunit ribosomal protein L25 [Parcubacteria group bacterium Gr01-1014_2]